MKDKQFISNHMSNIENQIEEWRDIKDYKGFYQVSNLGRIKSLERIVKHSKGGVKMQKERILKTSKSRYELASLSKEGCIKSYAVHRIVAETFIPNPKNKPQVNHKDGNILNNSAMNLEWCTASENTIHCIENSLRLTARGESSGPSKLSNDEVIEIRRTLASKKISYRSLAKSFGVNKQTISNIHKRKTWNHI